MKPKTDGKWRKDKWGWYNRHLPGVTSRVRRIGLRILISAATVDADGMVIDAINGELEGTTLAEAKTITEAIEPVVLRRAKGAT
jgi:hypothetical protein